MFKLKYITTSFFFLIWFVALLFYFFFFFIDWFWFGCSLLFCFLKILQFCPCPVLKSFISGLSQKSQNASLLRGHGSTAVFECQDVFHLSKRGIKTQSAMIIWFIFLLPNTGNGAILFFSSLTRLLQHPSFKVKQFKQLILVFLITNEN